MTQAKRGDTVKVHYTGTFDDGTQFDSSVGQTPLIVKIGAGETIPGFDKGLEGMAVGEKKRISIPPEEGYGEHNPELIHEVPRADFPEEMDLKIGLELQAQGPDGHSCILSIKEINEETITVDANHPMVGKHLNFELEVVDIA
ncbi:MAG: peptidylprolyl isomerase [Candidatus Polarisedimenticolaceae bacterium]|nr:peptidylprolyl isomerase [Candidatus Polarisedimenticolaceae bacterium]